MISILSSFHYFHQKYTFEVIYGDRLPTPVFLGFPCGSAAKESAYSAGDLGSIPGLGRFPGEGKGYLLQYSGLENSMDCIVHGVANSRTRLDNFHFHKICTLQSKASTSRRLNSQNYSSFSHYSTQAQIQYFITAILIPHNFYFCIY